MTLLSAHKGVEKEYPENTMASFRAAVAQGYRWIELDLGVTKDHVFVTLHNDTVNSKGRYADGSEISEPTPIDSLTFEEARKLDFGLSFSEEFRGEKIPNFREVLALAEETGVGLKIDNKIRRFAPDDLDRLYALLAGTKAKFGITCWDEDCIQRVTRELPNAEIHMDGITDPEILRRIAEYVPREKGIVWLGLDHSRSAWAPVEWFADDEKAAAVKKHFRLGLWSLGSVEGFREATAKWQPDIAETDGTIKPCMIEG